MHIKSVSIFLLFFLLPLTLWSTPFKVVGYNVENLFDAHYSGKEYDDYTNNLSVTNCSRVSTQAAAV